MPRPRKSKRARGVDHGECSARIAKLEALVADLQTLVERQTKIVEEQAATIKKQAATIKKQAVEIKDLKRRLGQDSSNSDKPPSTDPPGKPPKQKRERGKRKPGGQPGREGQTRALLPAEEVDEIQDHKPSACVGCGGKLRGSDSLPLRHQVTEVPPVKPTVVEYRLHSLTCTCGERTRAELPHGVPRGAFGPRLQAMVGYFTGACRISKRNTVQLLLDCFGVQISLGSIKRLENDLSVALTAPVDEARDFVSKQPVLGMDETSWRENKRSAWLWTATTEFVVAFMIRFSRGSKVAKELVGDDYRGFLISDRWSAYSWIKPRRRQACWAHLRRDFQKLAEAGGELGPIGEALGDCCKRLFKQWHRVRDGTLKRSSFQTYVSPIRAEVSDLLHRGAECTQEKLSSLCRGILDLEVSLWTFVRVPGVEPTNNHSERSLRHAVIWRKTSFGTQSEAGTVFVERILTAAGSLRLQGRNVLDYLAETCSAALEERPGPSLLPQAAPVAETLAA